jgi:hypothetical protein
VDPGHCVIRGASSDDPPRFSTARAAWIALTRAEAAVAAIPLATTDRSADVRCPWRSTPASHSKWRTVERDRAIGGARDSAGVADQAVAAPGSCHVAKIWMPPLPRQLWRLCLQLGA